jgi:hypothetical protein
MPASNRPKKKRVVINPPQFETNPWQIMTTPNMNIQNVTRTNHVSSPFPSPVQENEWIKHTPDMGAELLEQDVRRDFANNVRHEKDRQRSVVLVASLNVQFLLQSQNSSVTDVHTIQTRRKG